MIRYLGGKAVLTYSGTEVLKVIREYFKSNDVIRRGIISWSFNFLYWPNDSMAYY